MCACKIYITVCRPVFCFLGLRTHSARESSWINPVEHIRHPIQNCEASQCAYWNSGEATNYARALLDAAGRFVSGATALPPKELFQYSNYSRPSSHPLTHEVQLRAARKVLRADEPGRTCGVPRGQQASASTAN